jgi:hypothetical protein
MTIGRGHLRQRRPVRELYQQWVGAASTSCDTFRGSGTGLYRAAVGRRLWRWGRRAHRGLARALDRHLTTDVSGGVVTTTGTNGTVVWGGLPAYPSRRATSRSP